MDLACWQGPISPCCWAGLRRSPAAGQVCVTQQFPEVSVTIQLPMRVECCCFLGHFPVKFKQKTREFLRDQFEIQEIEKKNGGDARFRRQAPFSSGEKGVPKENEHMFSCDDDSFVLSVFGWRVRERFGSLNRDISLYHTPTSLIMYTLKISGLFILP